MAIQSTKENIVFNSEVPRKVLRVALFRSPTANIISDLASKFEGLHNCHVIIDVYPYELLKQNIQSDLSQKIGRYDVFTVDCTWLAEFAEAGYFEPLEEYTENKNVFDKRKYRPEDLAKKIDTYLCFYKNKRYGFPLISNIQILAYRKDLYEKYLEPAGIRPPGKNSDDAWAWEEFRKAAKIIKEKTNLSSASIRAKSPALVVYNWYPYISGSHSHPKMDRLKKALKLIKSFFSEKLAPETSIVWSHEDPVNWLASGKLSMDQVFNLEMAYWTHTSAMAGKIDFAMMPRNEDEDYSHPTLGGYSLGISKISKNKQLAFQFIAWATSPVVHRRIVEAGGTPCRYSELDDKRIKEEFPYFEILKESLPKASARPKIPEWASLEMLVAGEIMQYVTGQKNLEQAVAAIEKSGSQIIE